MPLEQAMLKTVLAGTAAIVIAGSSFVYAQQRNDGPAGPDAQRHGRPSAEDIGAFTDARIAALKAGLELTPEQEKNWPAFETALRNLEQLHAARGSARREGQAPADRIERLRRRADAMTKTGTALRQLADAEEPLLNSLNDTQKRRFFILARMEGGFGGSEGREEGRGGSGQMEGWPGRRADRDDWRERGLAERPRTDWRSRRGFDEPRGRDGWEDRRGSAATNGMDRYGAGDPDDDSDR
jgi:zinc resistance-associated protein